MFTAVSKQPHVASVNYLLFTLLLQNFPNLTKFFILSSYRNYFFSTHFKTSKSSAAADGTTTITTMSTHAYYEHNGACDIIHGDETSSSNISPSSHSYSVNTVEYSAGTTAPQHSTTNPATTPYGTATPRFRQSASYWRHAVATFGRSSSTACTSGATASRSICTTWNRPPSRTSSLHRPAESVQSEPGRFHGLFAL